MASETEPPATDQASIKIAASAQRCYELVSDITQMGRLSPECTGGRWLGKATGPAVGARFIGTNRRGLIWWFTFNKVVAADPGREFAFETTNTNIRWSYRFAGDGDHVTATEQREEVGPRPAAARIVARFLLGGGEEHEQELREGMKATLERLKSLAEAAPA